jgi:hypothetical protein
MLLQTLACFFDIRLTSQALFLTPEYDINDLFGNGLEQFGIFF